MVLLWNRILGLYTEGLTPLWRCLSIMFKLIYRLSLVSPLLDVAIVMVVTPVHPKLAGCWVFSTTKSFQFLHIPLKVNCAECVYLFPVCMVASVIPPHAVTAIWCVFVWWIVFVSFSYIGLEWSRTTSFVPIIQSKLCCQIYSQSNELFSHSILLGLLQRL